MSNEKLQKMFVEDAPQQVDEIENVRSLSNYVLNLQKIEGEIEKEEALLKQKLLLIILLCFMIMAKLMVP